MTELPITPLQAVPDFFTPRGAGPAVFLKREDLLPFGGGNKVRRLLCWLDEQVRAGRPPGRVAALSDQGSHTFGVLSRMAAEGRTPIRSLLFWERATPPTPYSRRIREGYLHRPDVVVQPGSLPGLLLRCASSRLFKRSEVAVLGIGGSVRTVAQPYRGVFAECREQLGGQGKGRARTWHVLPVASGNMADDFLRSIREGGRHNHRLVGVLTGPLPSRLLMRLHYGRERKMTLLRMPLLAWQQYLEAAAEFFGRTGVWLDPNHAIHAARALARLKCSAGPDDAIVLWVTCPFIPDLDFSAAGSP